MEPEFYIWGVLLAFMLGALFVLSGGPITIGAPASNNDALTAKVIASEPPAPEPCDCLQGRPVCAALGHHLNTYPSVCHAECAGAEVVFSQRCAAIPTLN